MAKRHLSSSSRGLLVVTLALIAMGGLLVVLPPESNGQRHADLPAFDLQGHRGARGLHPENSLPGFAAALAIGVTTLEMDLGFSRDGVVVVTHDRRLHPDRSRRPNGQWLEDWGPPLIDLDLADIQSYDVGRLKPESKAAKRFAKQQGRDGVVMPTLAAVFEQAEAQSGGTIRYNLETKISPLKSQEGPKDSPDVDAFVDAILEVIAKAGVGERVTIQSFDWRSLVKVQELAPEIPTVYLTAEQDWLDNIQRSRPGTSPWTAGHDVDRYDSSIPALVAAAGGSVWSPYFRDLRASDLAEAHRRGLKVVVWTVNQPADMVSLIDMGVDGIISDYPDRLRAVMAEKGLDLPPPYPASSAE